MKSFGFKELMKGAAIFILVVLVPIIIFDLVIWEFIFSLCLDSAIAELLIGYVLTLIVEVPYVFFIVQRILIK